MRMRHRCVCVYRWDLYERHTHTHKTHTQTHTHSLAYSHQNCKCLIIKLLYFSCLVVRLIKYKNEIKQLQPQMNIYLFSCTVKCFAGVKMQTKHRRRGEFFCIAPFIHKATPSA